ncbi:unnamed protein product [Owenia fusiformis]|uniref:Uncharacterized protein n=1 Tax=Owenia fusiformis TaxID=6347 RepID=A0A8J1YAN6_OWEFU|nr:unnamed protein product [Owenia fusiformis]
MFLSAFATFSALVYVVSSETITCPDPGPPRVANRLEDFVYVTETLRPTCNAGDLCVSCTVDHCRQSSGLGTPGAFPEGVHTLTFEGIFSDVFSSWTRTCSIQIHAQVVRCGDPPNEPNGHYACDNDMWGSQCVLGCFSGYRPAGGGSSPMECKRTDPNGVNGSWQNVPHCERIP